MPFSLSDILTTIQNGTVGVNNLSQILSHATANSSSLRVTLASTYFVTTSSAVSGSSNVIVSITKQIFTASTTYFPTTNMAFCIAEGVGGGGGGGGSSGNATANVSGGGGGGGGYAKAYLTAATVGTSQAVTIGSGGAGGTAGTNNGSPGTATTLGSLLSAGGGSGGTGINVGVLPLAVTGGVSTTGDILIQGGYGGFGSLIGNTNTVNSFGPSGSGGNSFFGSGGQGTQGTNATAGRGSSGYLYGGGGAGAYTYNDAVTSSGAPGAGGILIITEFIHG